MLAVIGGSGLSRLPELNISGRRIVRTPYGLPSSPLLFGRLGKLDIVFLSRHGFDGTVAPHEINYRANIWALQSVGVRQIIGISSVVSINPELENGTLVLPHDLIDYTARPSTFFEGSQSAVVYTDFTQPYSAPLRAQLLQHINSRAVAVHTEAVYACLQGPRWPTMAEIRRYRNDGADVLGMTGMPEAILAREAGLDYAHLCGVTGINCVSSSPQGGVCGRESQQAIDTIRSLLAGL